MKIVKTFHRHRQKYDSIHPLRRFLINRFLTKIFVEIEKQKPASILDIGCGEGRADQFFLKKNAGLNILGIDTDSRALRIAKKNCSQMKVKPGSIYQIPFSDDSFDLVICLEVLEHLKRPKRALEEMKRVGNHRGIITVPHEPFFSLASFFSGKYLRWLGRHPQHLHFWSKERFKNLLQEHFLKVEVGTSFPWLIGIVKSKG